MTVHCLQFFLEFKTIKYQKLGWVT